MTQPTVAVLGAGTMGAGMARSLLRAGFPVRVWNRTPDRLTPLSAAGAEPAASVGQAVEGADVVITMLFDAAAVLEVTQEIAAHLRPDGVWLQCSTVGPAMITELAGRVGDSVRLVDAPVLGTKQPAEQGKLVVLASGPSEAVDAARPVIDAIGSRLVVVDDQPGQASALKLVCNTWLATLTAGAAQALALAEELSVDPELFLEAVRGGTQDTPYFQRKGAQMIAGDYAPSFSIAAAYKDMQLARGAAVAHHVPTELLDALVALLGRAADSGVAGEDIAAVRRAFDNPGDAT